MQIDCKGRAGSQKFLCLGVQTNKDKVQSEVIKRAKSWAPKKCKSFSIKNFGHTDYHGRASEEITGYASFEAHYYTTEKEGTNKLTTE